MSELDIVPKIAPVHPLPPISRSIEYDHRIWHEKIPKKWKVECSQRCLSKFLNPLKLGQTVWNQLHRVDRGFLLVPASPFLPHLSHGCVPEEVLDEFVCDRGRTFLAAPWLMDHFNSLSLEDGAQNTVVV